MSDAMARAFCCARFSLSMRFGPAMPASCHDGVLHAKRRHGTLNADSGDSMPATSLEESLSSLLAATVAFAIGTSVVLRDRKREQFVLFAVFVFNLGLFHLARFFYGFSGLHLFGWFAQTISLLLPWSADRSLSSFVPAVD